jgi:hypothetical protein
MYSHFWKQMLLSQAKPKDTKRPVWHSSNASYNQPTQLSIVLPENLIVPLLVKKFPAFMEPEGSLLCSKRHTCHWTLPYACSIQFTSSYHILLRLLQTILQFHHTIPSYYVLMNMILSSASLLTCICFLVFYYVIIFHLY